MDKRTERMIAASTKFLALLNKHHAPPEPVKIEVVEPEPTNNEEVLCIHCAQKLRNVVERTTPKIRDIKNAVSDYFGVTILDLDSARRTQPLTTYRQIAMYLCRHMTTRSYPEIGRFFGGRDHTTVLHAAQNVASRIKSDWRVAFDVAHLEQLV